MSEILLKLGEWNWFILAVLLIVLELVIPGVHFLWFGIAAAIVGIIALSTGIAWQMQLIAFAVVAVITVFVVRRFADPRSVSSDEPDLNVRGAQYIGRTFVVSQAISQGRGKIRVGDTLWHAEGEDAAVGSRVTVVGVDGTALVVERADAQEQ